MAHQRNDMENWGRGRFSRFLVADGLKLDDIAFMNLAWCATAENINPMQMSETCFDRFTQAALGALAPDIVVLSGSASHRFAGRIENSCTGASIVKTLHYAHREGNVAENRAMAELRILLAIWIKALSQRKMPFKAICSCAETLKTQKTVV